MKKTLVIILSICLLLGCFVGCADNSTKVSDEVSEAVEPVSEAAETIEAETTEDADPSSAGLVSEMPMSDEPVTLSIWAMAPQGHSITLPESYGDYTVMQNLEEKSNVHMEWQEVSSMVASEQFNIMAASGEYTDIITSVGTCYTGGVTKAYSDDIIADLTELIDEYAPNYMATINANPEIARECLDDNGHRLVFHGINDAPEVASGLLIRQDWLDTVGMDIPTTYDEMIDVLTAFKTTYDCSSPLLLTQSCVISDTGDLSSGFGVPGMNIAELSTYHLFITEDGSVSTCLIEDGYKEFLGYLHTLYENGLISPDFYSISNDMMSGEAETYVTTSQSGVFRLNVNSVQNMIQRVDDPDCAMTPMADIGKEAGHINHFSDASLINGNSGACISSTCSNPEVAAKWLDYWYSDQGMYEKNYGPEGVSFEFIDGEPTFTDAILNNEWGVSGEVAVTYYNLQNMICGRTITTLTDQFATDLQREAKQLWASNQDATQTLPSSLSLTEDESETYANRFGDISTYAAESIPRFITGELNLDSDWDDFQTTLKNLGIGDCVAAYQSAYERYLSR